MNWIDIIILIVLGFFAIKGWFRGVLIESFTLVGLILGYFTAMNMMGIAANQILNILSIPRFLSSILGFLIVFLIIFFIFRLAAGFLHHLIKKTLIVWFDRLGGGFFGLCKGILITSLITILLSLSPIANTFQKSFQKSMIYKPVQRCAPMIFDGLTWMLPKFQSFSDTLTKNIIGKNEKTDDPDLKKRVESLMTELNRMIDKRNSQGNVD